MAIAIIDAISMIIVAILGVMQYRVKRDNEQYRKQREEIDRRNATEKFLSMKMQDACIDLSYVTSLAVTGGHTNGNVEAAQKKAQEAQEAYREFMMKEYSEEITKI